MDIPVNFRGRMNKAVLEKQDAFSLAFDLGSEGSVSFPYGQFLGAEIDGAAECVCVFFTSATAMLRGKALSSVFAKISEREASRVSAGKCGESCGEAEIFSVSISRGGGDEEP